MATEGGHGEGGEGAGQLLSVGSMSFDGKRIMAAVLQFTSVDAARRVGHLLYQEVEIVPRAHAVRFAELDERLADAERELALLRRWRSEQTDGQIEAMTRHVRWRKWAGALVGLDSDALQPYADGDLQRKVGERSARLVQAIARLRKHAPSCPSGDLYDALEAALDIAEALESVREAEPTPCGLCGEEAVVHGSYGPRCVAHAAR